MVNSEIAFYDRTNDTPLSVGTLAALTGESGNLFDPQMICDTGTNRFYYVTDNIVSSVDNRLEIGFSTRRPRRQHGGLLQVRHLNRRGVLRLPQTG